MFNSHVMASMIRGAATQSIRSSSPLRSIFPSSSAILPSQQSQQSAQSKRNYHEKVIDHYENPRNAGSFGKEEEDIGTGLVGAPACGDVMKLQIKVDPANDNIVDAKFKTFGCCSAIASSSFATEWIKGKSIEEASTIKNSIIANELKLPPVKLHCSMLAEDAIKAALSDYIRNKKMKEETEKAAASGEKTG